MPSRRSHQKSHHGCEICKRRKVKCDERRPACHACLKRQLTCSFLKDYVPTPSHADHLADQSNPSDRPVSINNNPLPLVDLELLHQWYTSTAHTLCRDQKVGRVMKYIIPREGFTHPFLMHGLLTIAALHRVHLDGLKGNHVFVEKAIQHKQQALSLYTPHLKNITKSNCNALFAFSCLLSILYFASQISDNTRTVKGIADVLGIFRLVRGVAVIVAQGRQWIESSEMSVLMRSGHFEPDGLDCGSERLPSGVQAQYQQLLNDCRETCHDSILVPTYLSSVHILMSGYAAYSIASDNTIGLAWPVLVNDAFFNLLLKGDQLSLVILAHYGAIMALLDDTWWLKGWGRLVVEFTADLLHPTWLCKIAWPLEVIQKENPN